jgi:hypothetical protein
LNVTDDTGASAASSGSSGRLRPDGVFSTMPSAALREIGAENVTVIGRKRARRFGAFALAGEARGKRLAHGGSRSGAPPWWPAPTAWQCPHRAPVACARRPAAAAGSQQVDGVGLALGHFLPASASMTLSRSLPVSSRTGCARQGLRPGTTHARESTGRGRAVEAQRKDLVFLDLAARGRAETRSAAVSKRYSGLPA